ncbi:hypothetical protein PtB15_5B1 [Puccinia triticina]|nr:hypothetical protein PtB15_5B1 [Puccinia triticina]
MDLHMSLKAITCSEYEPKLIVSNLLDRLMALSTIVIYSCHLRPLSDLQTLLSTQKIISTLNILLLITG